MIEHNLMGLPKDSNAIEHNPRYFVAQASGKSGEAFSGDFWQRPLIFRFFDWLFGK